MAMLKSMRNPKKISVLSENDRKWLFLVFLQIWLIFENRQKGSIGWINEVLW